jgi:hypothetical protein
MTRTPEPFPHDVWLNVTLNNVPRAKRAGVIKRLQKLPGWNSSLTGDEGGGLRYLYRRGRDTTIPEGARAIIRRAGSQSPQVNSFVVWRVDLNFREPLAAETFVRMIAIMCAMPTVLDAHGIGDNRAGVYVEFRGKPSAEVMGRIIDLTAQHLPA